MLLEKNAISVYLAPLDWQMSMKQVAHLATVLE